VRHTDTLIAIYRTPTMVGVRYNMQGEVTSKFWVRPRAGQLLSVATH